MSYSEAFNIGYLKVHPSKKEEVFVSVTPCMRYGPGIQRDGITTPRMTDPHTVDFVMHSIEQRPKDKKDFPATENAFVQRAGTWSLFDHVSEFIDQHKDYKIIGIQSCGDLTMNPWHVAFISKEPSPILCHLKTAGDPESITEQIHDRIYRCFVKWKPSVNLDTYCFIDLKFQELDDGWEVLLMQDIIADGNVVYKKETLITEHVEFALSGKQIVQNGYDISLSSAIDRFQDVRHIFNVPVVPVRDHTGKVSGTINFGEHILFNELNARRGALGSPIIIDFCIPNRMDLVIHYNDVEDTLINKYHYNQTINSPARRGEFRKYSDTSIEIFYRHNVYPFGVLGFRKGEIVCLSSGGLSGRVGNTLEGIIRVMFDFFASEDAIVLDEGYDTFHILNPNTKKEINDPDNYEYDNKELLKQVAAYTLWRTNQDQEEFKKKELEKASDDRYKLDIDMWKWPLNEQICNRLTKYCIKEKVDPAEPKDLTVMAVEPRRSQMRSVLIFAVRKDRINTSKNQSRKKVNGDSG
ncbi:MAG: hypothetical protein KAQ68_06645 [Clostridiales bacterium]|nr:hypothetical protein [Clostridiales bacterium]